MPSQDDKILNQMNKKEKIENEFQETHNKIIQTIKDRKRSEKEYLDIIKKQKKYWEGQLENTDPEKNKDRYNHLKENIKREENLIIQIKEELNRIDEQFKMEKEHQKIEEEHIKGNKT